jgi:hypothetical protein
MNKVVIGASLLACLIPSPARAEADRGPSGPELVAPARAWELTFAQGYSQGFGRADDGAKLTDYARGGFSPQVGVGYRLDPRLMLGAYLEGTRYFASSSMPDDTTTYGAAFGVQANWHFLPFSRLDPWIGVGTGGRAYFIDPSDGPAVALYGVDMLRVRVGADYRLGPSTSVGPMLGVTATSFIAHQTAGSDAEDIDRPGFSSVIFAGMQGRFEIGGERVTATGRRVASR